MVKKRCPICNRRFPKRSCMSRNEDVCAMCCGIMRSKTGCPSECKFATKRVDKEILYGREIQIQQTYCDTTKEVKESMSLKVPDNDIEGMVFCTIMMEEDYLTKDERLMYRRRHSDLERKNRIVVAEGRDEDDNPCIFLHPDHVGRNGFIDSRLYRPGDDIALEVSWIGRGHIQVRRIDGGANISEVRRIETSHGETLEDDGSWW